MYKSVCERMGGVGRVRAGHKPQQNIMGAYAIKTATESKEDRWMDGWMDGWMCGLQGRWWVHSG